MHAVMNTEIIAGHGYCFVNAWRNCFHHIIDLVLFVKHLIKLILISGFKTGNSLQL